MSTNGKRLNLRVLRLALVSVTFVGCGEDKQGNIIKNEVADTAVGDAVAEADVADTVESDTAPEEVQEIPCAEGLRGCEAQSPATCTDGEWVVDGVACSGATPFCLDGVCVVCSPGDAGCGANTPRVCADDGTWTYAEPCPAEAPLCLDGGCVECSPGQMRCHPTGTSVERCDETGL